MTSVRIIHGDCRTVMRAMAENSVDAIVCDPPYHLTNRGGGPHGKGADTPYARARAGASSTGFMGMTWDGGDTFHDPATWREALRVLKPGGHLLAFGGSRTFHRLAVAIEDAGFELRDTVLNLHDGQPEEVERDCPWMAAWGFGTGFPKSLNVAVAIDKAAGVDSSVVGVKAVGKGNGRGPGFNHDGDTAGVPVREPVTDEAKRWAGWGTALKPAFEPIVMARKPLVGTVAESVQAHGPGALNIDASRIPTDPSIDDPRLGGAGTWSTDKMAKKVYAGGYGGERVASSAIGRWPANLVHDGSPDVVALFPTDAGAASPVRGTEPSPASVGRVTGERDRVPGAFHADTGSAARFFWCPKASRKDRNEGLEGQDKAPLNWSSGTQSPGTFQSAGTDRMVENSHPTVKPTDLMRYLVRMVTPPGGTVLDITCGSGSTLKAATLEGFNAIGIEADAQWVRVAAVRAAANMPLLVDVTVETAA